MYLCGIHNFSNCVHREGVTSFYAMTLNLTYPSYIEYIALTTAVPFNFGHPSAISRSRQLKAALQVFFPLQSTIDISILMKKIKKTSLLKSDKIPSSVYCICFAVCTHFFEKNALTFEMH